MIDIHTHILPGVDDGVKTYEEALEVLKFQLNQGIHKVVLTPHVHNSAQKVSSKEFLARFNELKARVLKDLPQMTLYLGYEVKYNRFKDTAYENLTFQGFKKPYILIEFSVQSKDPVVETIYNLVAKGLVPIIAHIERYIYLTLDDIKTMRSYGALIQVNSGGILGHDGKAFKKHAHQLLKADLVDFIASDTHNLDQRKPTLVDALKKVPKNFKMKELEV